MPDISINREKYTKTVVTWSIIAGISLIVIITGLFTWYTATTTQAIVPDDKSKSRLTTLNEVFSSAMGRRWPFVLLIFVILLAVMLVFIYISSKNNAITIEMSDHTAKIFSIILLIFICIFFIFIVLLAVYKYRQLSNNELDDPNYIPDQTYNSKTKTALAIVGGILLLLFLGGFGVWFLWLRKSSKAPS